MAVRVGRRAVLSVGLLAAVLLLGGLALVPHGACGQSWLASQRYPVRWTSGASATGAGDDDAFARWRGTRDCIAGTFADNDQAMVGLYTLQPGAELGSWDRDLDVAVGAFDAGESWSEAATGAYDDRWRRSLRALAARRAGSAGTTYLRFAHESNGDFYPWHVTAASTQDFTTAWRRYRALQREEFPAARLVFCLNRESVGSDVDWRTTFPGRDVVDVVSVDYYNQYPFATTQAAFDDGLDDVDGFGAPKGLDQHLAFARSVGLPFAVSEWSSNASMGDSPAFMAAMHGWFARAAARDELLYEVFFNATEPDQTWSVHPKTRMPQAAQEYRRLW